MRRWGNKKSFCRGLTRSHADLENERIRFLTNADSCFSDLRLSAQIRGEISFAERICAEEVFAHVGDGVVQRFPRIAGTEAKFARSFSAV